MIDPRAAERARAILGVRQGASLDELRARHRALVKQWHPDRFASLIWREGLGGAPVIDGSAAVFECSRFAEYPGGDHVIFLGRVDRLMSATHTPLVFFDGGFCAAPPEVSR